MNKFFKRQPLAIKVVLSYLLVSIIFISIQVINSYPVAAQSTININADIINLRTRINRLEQEVNRLRNLNYSSRGNISHPTKATSPPDKDNPPIVDGCAFGASDPSYERLATLLIELKEDVRDIDKRLTEIEKRIVPK